MDRVEYIDRKTGKKIEENPPGKGFIKLLYGSFIGKIPLELLFKRKIISYLYGRYMDSKRSTKMIPSFVIDNQINMDESKLSQEQFETFNQFFYRELKSGVRGIDDGIISPADGKIVVFDKIDDNREFFIKGRKFSLSEYLKNDDLVNKFYGGSMAIIRLAPADYHRFHFPVNGKVLKSTKIDGDYYSVSPLAMRQSLEIFMENKREYSTIENDQYGEVIYSEIGATMVGSIVQTYSEDSEVKKGDEKGYFKFGGSSILLLFQKGRMKFNEDLLKNSRAGFETKINMGEQIGS